MDLSNGLPDGWITSWPVIAGFLTLIGGAIAWMNGMFRTRGTDLEERQRARDVIATQNQGATFKSATELIEQYQEAFLQSRAEIAEIKKQCQEETAMLRARADEVESRLLTRIGALERQIQLLQDECSELRMRDYPLPPENRSS